MSKDNNTLDQIQELENVRNQLEALPQNKNISGPAVSDLDTINEIITEMGSSIDSVEKNDNIIIDDKKNKITDIIMDTIDTLTTLNDTIYSDKIIENTLSEAAGIIQTSNQGIQISPSTFSVPGKLSDVKEQEVGKHLSNLQNAMNELTNSSEITSNTHLHNRLQAPIAVMQSGLEHNGTYVDAQSKIMLNTLGAIGAILDENNMQQSPIRNEFNGLKATIEEIRNTNNLPIHKAAQDAPQLPSAQEMQNAQSSIKESQIAITELFSKEMQNTLGNQNSKQIRTMIQDMDKAINRIEIDQSLSQEIKISAQSQIINNSINQINDQLDQFDKALDLQKGKSKFDKIKNVLKATAKYAISFGSKESKIELAAATFKLNEKTVESSKTSEFKKSKSHAEKILKERRISQQNKSDGRSI